MLKGSTRGPRIFRAILDLPAGNKREDPTDAGDADFLLTDHLSYAEEAVDVGPGIPSVAGLPPVRDNQSLALVHTDGRYRDADKIGGLADSVEQFDIRMRVG